MSERSFELYLEAMRELRDSNRSGDMSDEVAREHALGLGVACMVDLMSDGVRELRAIRETLGATDPEVLTKHVREQRRKGK